MKGIAWISGHNVRICRSKRNHVLGHGEIAGKTTAYDREDTAEKRRHRLIVFQEFALPCFTSPHNGIEYLYSHLTVEPPQESAFLPHDLSLEPLHSEGS